MNPYVSITQIDRLFFNSCEGCQNGCCDGSKFKFSPLILDDFSEVYKHFKIVFAYLNNELRVLLVLTQKGSTCRYYINNKCSIYKYPPPACKIYPISPYYEDILIDTSCQAVGEIGDLLATTNSINSSFHHKRLESFNKKYEKTKEFLNEIEKDLILFDKHEGVEVYKFKGEHSENEYIKMHLDSLSL